MDQRARGPPRLKLALLAVWSMAWRPWWRTATSKAWPHSRMAQTQLYRGLRARRQGPGQQLVRTLWHWMVVTLPWRREASQAPLRKLEMIVSTALRLSRNALLQRGLSTRCLWQRVC
jgi:hypothetical protein